MAVVTNAGGKKGRAGAVWALALALVLAACGNALQDELDSLKKELADKNAQIETLQNEQNAAENSIADLEAQRDALGGLEASLRGQLTDAGIIGATLQDQIEVLLANETEHTGLIASIREQLEEADISGATLQEQIDSLVLAKTNLETSFAAAEDAIALRDRQIDVMMIGGQFHGKIRTGGTDEAPEYTNVNGGEAWFTQHKNNVTAAQNLEEQVAIVFVGDKVIADMPLANITARSGHARHPIGIEGDNIGDIKYRMGYRMVNGVEQFVATDSEMPAKPAYIVAHAGQKEVEESGLTTMDNGTKATKLGQDIGAFYAWIRAKYPTPSTIFSGIIPRNPIGTNNTSDLNGQINNIVNAMSGATTQVFNNSNVSSTAETLANDVEATLPYMPATITMLNSRERTGVNHLFSG
jgi:hypothetical protein